jgi:protocatechuate 3,4-dioxygenase beta subunit
VTNDDGRYQFTGLAAGRYTVTLFAAAFVPPIREQPGPPGKTVTLTEGETADLDFALTRGAVITGRVRDATGQPVIGEVVNIAAVDANGQGRSTTSRPSGNLANQETDDRGIYRLYGLPAGRYRVSVGTTNESLNLKGPRHYYPLTYHPNVTDEAQAKIIELTEGGEATNIDITLSRPARAYDVSGRIVEAETGQSVPNLMFGYGRTSGGSSFANTGPRSDVEGNFHLEGILPGSYFLVIQPDDNSEFYSDGFSFEVTDADLTGLEIKVHRGGSISGVAVIEGQADPALLAMLSQAQVYSMMLPSGLRPTGTFPRPSFTKLGADGSFRIGGLMPGKTRISPSSLPKGLTLARIERDGVQQQAGMIDVGPGEQVTGVRLVFNYAADGTGTIRGQVQIIGGTLAEGHSPGIIVRRVDAGPAPGNTVHLTDSRGRFVIESLDPGNYELTLTLTRRPISSTPGKPPTLPPPPPQIPSTKQTVTVTGGAETPVSFVLDLSKKEQP